MRNRWWLGTALALAVSATASADVVTDWNNVTLDVIREEPLTPPVAERTLAIVHVAIFDAVNGVDRLYEPYLVTHKAPRGASAEAAAAGAAFTALVKLYPDRGLELVWELLESLDQVPNGPGKWKGLAWGARVGRKIYRARRNDGWDSEVEYTPSGEFGRWQPTPPGFLPALLPQWGLVTPWTMLSADQFRPEAAPAVGSPEFAIDYNEVKDLGEVDSPTRTADQTEIAYFWEDGGGSVTPGGHWMVIAQGLADELDTDLVENARLFALLALTQADAAIVAWDAKFHYDYCRPVTNIRLEADLDGNPDTVGDPDWLSELPTPPFPTYTSGHSTFSGSSARILERFLGTDDYSFCGQSPDPERWPDHLPGVERCWESFSEAAEEAGQSRVYGGIHWQFDNTAGLTSGRALADHVFENFLTPRD